MTLDDVLNGFLSFTQDAVAVGYRAASDQNARLSYVNKGFSDLFGYEPEQVLGKEASILHTPADWQGFVTAIAPHIKQGAPRFQAEGGCLRADGSTFWTSISLFFCAYDETGGRYSVAIYRDISALKAREDNAKQALQEHAQLLLEKDATYRQLLETQSRLVAAMDSYPDPFSIYDKDYVLVTCNRAYAASMAKDPARIRSGLSFSDIFTIAFDDGLIPEPPEGREEHLARTLREFPAGESGKDIEFAGDVHYRILRNTSENGDFCVLHVNITDSVRQRRALEENARELARTNAEITHQALHDELTGLGNRRYLGDAFETLRARQVSEGGELAALHLDLDRFKQINDTIGHAAGDSVLVDVAARITARVHPDDIVARIGGDEFVILIWEATPSERPIELARQLVSDMSIPTVFEERTCRFGASVGIARTPLAAVDGLLTYSDIALYKAKRAGRNQVGIFDEEDVQDMRRVKETADDIIRGLEHSEFVPYYQPQIDAKTGAIVGVEALARWMHPQKGVLSPRSFLDIAGEMNVEADIDRMIFEKAIAECASVFAGSDPFPSLSFNVSAKRISEGGFGEIVKILKDYPGEVAFELLETIYLEEEGDSFFFQLDQLRDLGILIEVDDFGSGRASVVALQRIAPHRLKIDQRLVMPITEGENSVRLVQSIIEIGNALDIGVVAEGVETEEHARILRDLGAERLQGYHFAAPLPLENLRDYLEGTKQRAAV